jgi:hypothetical protein
VDLRGPLLPTEASPVREAALEVGVWVGRLEQGRGYSLSMTMAMPWPPPTHMDSRP